MLIICLLLLLLIDGVFTISRMNTKDDDPDKEYMYLYKVKYDSEVSSIRKHQTDYDNNAKTNITNNMNLMLRKE